jgi:outer membrane protein OmpA-like peptidoglycan-associated protein
MRFLVRAGLTVSIVGLLAGCAMGGPKPPQLVVLVPDGSGRVGTVVVTGRQGSTTLNQAYAAASMDETGKTETRIANKPEIERIFSSAIEARPARAVSFLLYFREGTDEYTPESRKAFEGVFAEIARRKAAEIAVIGHTDRFGSLRSNDELSKKRAERVRKDFVDRGIPEHTISVAGRGEREPVVPTADEVREPRNRRVEISVR